MMKMKHWRRRFVYITCLWFSVVYACSVYAGPEQADAWPKTLVNSDGSRVVIPARPERILSTSVTVTGTLLAIDAPVVASASATTNAYFAQWQEVAKAKEVTNVWPAGRINLEAAYAVRPDLIIVSAGGADSAMAHVEMLRAIAPVLIVDYAVTDWQGLATTLGRALGLEQSAQQRITSFNQYVEDVRQHIHLPEGKVNIVSYNGPGIINPVGTATGTHGKLLRALGFDVVTPPGIMKGSREDAGDFIRSEYEQLIRLNGASVFLLRRRVDDVNGLLNDPVLQNLTAVKNKQVWGMGENSFRMDFYSATETVDIIANLFSSP